MKVQACRNKLLQREKGQNQKIYYSHLSRMRYNRGNDKLEVVLKNCRKYLDFMETYISEIVKENNSVPSSLPKNDND